MNFNKIEDALKELRSVVNHVLTLSDADRGVLSKQMGVLESAIEATRLDLRKQLALRDFEVRRHQINDMGEDMGTLVRKLIDERHSQNRTWLKREQQ